MTPPKTTKVALVQMQCGPDPAANMAKAIARIREAAQGGAQIVCLPELFRSQYFCQAEDHANFALAEEIPGPTTAELEKLARETGVVIVASLFEKRDRGSLPQHRGHHRRGRAIPGQVSQDAYPG